jgi:type I restriction-modification system DNA methylase subunit
MRPKPGEECHDYACGSAGLLVKLQLVAPELDPISKVPSRRYGQERTAESYAVAQMNAIIHDMSVEVARRHDDQSKIQDGGRQDPHLRDRGRQSDALAGWLEAF